MRIDLKNLEDPESSAQHKKDIGSQYTKEFSFDTPKTIRSVHSISSVKTLMNWLRKPGKSHNSILQKH